MNKKLPLILVILGIYIYILLQNYRFTIALYLLDSFILLIGIVFILLAYKSRKEGKVPNWFHHIGYPNRISATLYSPARLVIGGTSFILFAFLSLFFMDMNSQDVLLKNPVIEEELTTYETTVDWKTYAIELPSESCGAILTRSCNSPKKISLRYPKNWDLEPGSADEPGSLTDCPYVCKKDIFKGAFHVGCFSLGHYENGLQTGFSYDRLEEKEVFYNNIKSTKYLYFNNIDGKETLTYVSIEVPFNNCDFVFQSDFVNTIYGEFNSESDKVNFIDEMEKILNTITFQ